jgi:hypothetical protein
MYTKAEMDAGRAKNPVVNARVKRQGVKYQSEGLYHSKKNIEILEYWHNLHRDKSGDLDQLSDQDDG